MRSPIEFLHAPRRLERRPTGGLAGDLRRLLVASARIDGKEAVPEEAQDLAAVAVERRGDRIEELVERVDIDLPAVLFGEHRGFAHVAHDQCGADGLAVAALDLAAQHALPASPPR